VVNSLGFPGIVKWWTAEWWGVEQLRISIMRLYYFNIRKRSFLQSVLYTLSNTKTLFAVFVLCAWYLQLMQYIICSCTELHILPSIRYFFGMQNLYAKDSSFVSSIYSLLQHRQLHRLFWAILCTAICLLCYA